MNQRFLLGVLAILLMACQNSGNKQTSITGRIEGAQGKWLFFEKLLPESSKIIDSTQIDGEGRFQLTKKAEDMSFYRLRIGPEKRTNNYGPPDNVLILLTDSTETLTIESNAARFNQPLSITGSQESLLFGEVQAMAASANLRLDSMRQAIRLDFNHQPEEAQALFAAFQESVRLEIVAWIEAHQGAFATLQALSMLDPAQNIPVLDTTAKILALHYPNNPFVERLLINLEQLSKAAVGTRAPDFSVPNPQGNPVALADFLGKGKLILLDFWASWCRPCREENPNLVNTYKRFKSKGFEIFSVSLDRDKEPWVEAINSDKMAWFHGSDLGYWNAEPARLYNVNTIPNNFLLDQDGTILYRNLHGEQLNQVLAQHLE